MLFLVCINIAFDQSTFRRSRRAASLRLSTLCRQPKQSQVSSTSSRMPLQTDVSVASFETYLVGKMCYYYEVKHECGHSTYPWRKPCEIHLYRRNSGREMRACLNIFDPVIEGGPRCPHCENARILGIPPRDPQTAYGEARVFGQDSGRRYWQES